MRGMEAAPLKLAAEVALLLEDESLALPLFEPEAAAVLEAETV